MLLLLHRASSKCKLVLGEQFHLSSDKPRVIVPSARPIAAREIQLIDRFEEMQILRDAADRAIQGEGGVVFLHGEAGIGKTRLARELGTYARSQSMQVLFGRCPALFRMDGVPPYILWEETIKNYLEFCSPEQLNRVIGPYPLEVSRLVPEIKQKLRALPQSYTLSLENSRDRLFEAVTQFIVNIAKEAPLLVILDDLQWTDDSSLLLLHYLARGVYKEPLLILGAYRDNEVDEKHPLIPVLAELNRERLLQSVLLKRLSFDDVTEMIERILEQGDVPKEFCELIYEKTLGNPFFVEEVIKSLKEEEVIHRKANKWSIRQISKIEFPETIKSVIRKRLSRLDEESRKILTTASFIGNDFTFEALREATGFEEATLLQLMESMFKTELIKARVIRGEDVCSFADIIVRNAIYEEVTPLMRKKLHGTVGLALEKVYAKKIDSHYGELALHFLESGDREKAFSFFIKAGEKAADVYANSEAASHLESALNLVEESQTREKARILERLGEIESLTGKYEASMQHWNDALNLWNQLNERRTASRLHGKMAKTLWEKMGEAEKAEHHHSEALKFLETEPASSELANVYEDMGHMYYRIGKPAEALSSVSKALEISEKLNNSEVIASSHASLGTIYIFKGDLKKARESLEKALKIALENGYMETALRAQTNLGNALPSDENEAKLEAAKKVYDLAKKIGHVNMQSWGALLLGSIYFMMGNMDDGLLLFDESLVLDRKARNMVHLPSSLCAYGQIQMLRGEWDKALQSYEESLSLSLKTNDYQAIGWCYDCLGWFHEEKGEYERAKDFYDKAVYTGEKAGDVYGQMWENTSVARMCIELGDKQRAEELISKISEFCPVPGDKRLAAEVDLLRAMLLRTQREWEESIDHFEKALEQSEAIGARRWDTFRLARFMLEFAQVYLDRNQDSDKQKALDLLNEALEIFQRFGPNIFIEKVNSKILQVETRSQATSTQQPFESKPVLEPAASNRLETGHGELDKALLGGLPQSYTVILTSASCDERDSLVTNFLATGINKGEVAFLVTIDPGENKKLAQEFPNFYLFICNPQADRMIGDQPNIYKLKGVENLTDVSIALTSALRKLDDTATPSIRRACLEVVSDILMQHNATQTRRWLTGLLPELKAKNFTVLATIDPDMHPPHESRAILDLFEGELNVYEKQTKEGPQKLLRIRKMSGQDYSKGEIPIGEKS